MSLNFYHYKRFASLPAIKIIQKNFLNAPTIGRLLTVLKVVFCECLHDPSIKQLPVFNSKRDFECFTAGEVI